MSEKFHGIVNFNDKGDVICFCSYDEYLCGECKCRDKFDCPEAIIEITVLPNSKPSQQEVQTIKKVERQVDKTIKRMVQETNRIKQGVTKLEKAIKNSHFRI